MNFGNKLKDWKNRLKDRHMFSIVIGSFIVILALLGYIIKIRNDNKQSLENTYNHAFYELASYIDNINNLLSKAQISKDPSHGAKTMSEIWRQSNLAKTNLSELPIEQDVIAQTSKFLSQTSDFSYSLTMQTIDQIPVSNEQISQIASLSDYAEKLQGSISALSNELNSGKLYWNEIAKKGTATFKQLSNEGGDNSFTEISKNFQDYPGLIYDGPFSEHITDIKPVGITGEEIDSNKAIEIAKKFIEKNVTETSVYESAEANIPSFDVTLTLDNDDIISVSISKTGGHVLYMLYNKQTEGSSLTIDQAKQKASNFLVKKGYENMYSTYYMNENNVATINFAYHQGDVTIYPDLIKVQVAMDTGDIVGFEAQGYHFSHTTREIPTPRVSQEQAKSSLNPNLNIINSGMAIIPTDVKTEVLVYEFKGQVDGKEFIVYINAETGKEEDILIVLNTPDGVLTI